MILAAAIVPYYGSCNKREEPVKPSKGLEQLLAQSKDSISSKYEALRYYDDSLKAHVDSVLAGNIMAITYMECMNALNGYAERFSQSDIDNRSFAGGLAIQDKIRLNLKFISGLNKADQKMLVSQSLDLWVESIEYASMLYFAGRYDIRVYEELYRQGRRLKMKNRPLMGLAEHLSYFKGKKW